MRTFLLFCIHTWSVKNNPWILAMSAVCSKLYSPVSHKGPTTALRNFYKWPFLFHKIHTVTTQLQPFYMTFLYSQILSIVPLCGTHRKYRKYRNRLWGSNDSYNSLLLKMERPTTEVSRLWRLAIEVFKTLESLNPDFMHTYFKKGSYSARRKNGLVVLRAKKRLFKRA